MSMRSVLGLPAESRNIVFDTVRRNGWRNSPFTNDNLSSKKLAPGQTFRCSKIASSSPWYRLSEVTADSLVLLFQYLRTKSERLGFKPDKKNLERHLERCAMAVHLRNDMLNAAPGCANLIESKLMEAIRQADLTVETELESALLNKDMNFTIRDVRVLADILNQVKLPTNATTSQLMQEMQETQRTLDRENYELLLKEMSYDEKATQVYYNKLVNHGTASKSLRDEWRAETINTNNNAAASMMMQVSEFEVYDSSSAKCAQSCVAAFNTFRENRAKKLHMDPKEMVTVVLMNFSTACMSTVATQNAAASLARFILNENPNSVALVFDPVHTYKSGHLYLAQHNMLTMLSGFGLDVDRQFIAKFEKRHDARDKRPLVYPGHILTPILDDGIEKESIWRKSSLFNNNFAGPAKQLSARDMECIESLNPQSLPTGDAYPKNANKYCQLGEDCYTHLFNALFENVQVNHQQAVLFVDATAKWTHPFKALLKHRANSNVPHYYMGFVHSMEELEWLKHTLSDHIASQLQSKEIAIAGYEWRSLEPPKEMFEQDVPVPTLKRLVWQTSDDGLVTPTVSSETEQVWANHSEFGTQFREYVDALNDKMVEASSTILQSIPLKKRIPESSSTKSTSAKVRKVDQDATIPDNLVAIDAIPGDVVTDVATSVLKNNNSLTLSLRTEGKVYLLNTSDADATIVKGSMLAGFGKVAFRQLGDGVPAFDSSMDMMFEPKSSDDYLLMGANNNYCTFAEAMTEVEGQENCRICYHEIEKDLQQPQKFTLKPVWKVVARSKPKDQQALPITASSFASLVPPKWSDIVRIVFACQFKPTGLMPVRPVVVFHRDLTLPSKMALQLVF